MILLPSRHEMTRLVPIRDELASKNWPINNDEDINESRATFSKIVCFTWEI